MPRTIPDHVKSFHLTSTTSAATTYHFRPDKGSGWALATVNDATGELAIQSDWGNWTYRWPAMGMPEHDGRRITLTEFIGGRDNAHCDYLADKLTSYEERHLFDSYKTVDHLRGMLLKNRLEQGRSLIDWYADEEIEDRVDVGTDDPPKFGGMEWRKVRSYGQDEEWPLTKQTARSLYDALDDIKHVDDVQDFVRRFYEIDGYAWIGEHIEFEGDLKYEPSPHYYQLLFGILPALVAACTKTVRERTAGAPCLAPIAATAVQ